ncbi:S-adenosylmethionine-dependent methyltransferase [Naegleria gruberi]|uniref:S-adenosylmethionine-dependent methyltransferase n=1 Tax=Naegleria gruberi TaxID=5762 RepID=D2V0R2_NAEGR|nr:S-adenosylmethionine-dependent methyltransferase [Naegleria gruberi]EFC49561.1 S-adenosylmethionine-dependent methyltransferase [Naegleria gruberi]|eukprot:XP_002682305.1 S-adenosylmethionine-dependent methyltransferase [Naegleria gruberi strain NEG-M]
MKPLNQASKIIAQQFFYRGKFIKPTTITTSLNQLKFNPSLIVNNGVQHQNATSRSFSIINNNTLFSHSLMMQEEEGARVSSTNNNNSSSSSMATSNNLNKKMPEEQQQQNKRKFNHHNNRNKKNKKVKKEKPSNVIEAVTPLAHLTYEEQLVKKEGETLDCMREMFSEIKKSYGTAELPEYYTIQPEDEKLKDVHLTWCGILSSPQTEGYRNNCEFTCGYNSEDKPTVGFRQGLFSQGIFNAESPKDVKIVSDSMKRAVLVLQKFIEQHHDTYKCYAQKTHTGLWRLMKVRENRNGEMLIIVQINPTEISEEAMQTIKTNLISHFKSFDKNESSDLSINVKGLFLQQHTGVSNAAPTDAPLDLLYGEQTIVEEVLGLKFNISPMSFFQVNTKGVEVLYSKVKEWTLESMDKESNKERVLLDVCSGTGTIGSTMASSVSRVIGIEMVESSVNDARKNAQLNNIQNITFVCGKAEDTITTKMVEHNLNSSNVECVAVVDPPRSGLHKKVLESILRSPTIEKLIYVSCNPKTLVENAIRLCGPTSTVRASYGAFKPVKAIAVDMFPHTEHCEMICVFERKLKK